MQLEFRTVAALAVIWAIIVSPAALSDESGFAHGYSVFGHLKYPAGFEHYNYVNPDAPKGGQIKISYMGSFDSLNHFVVKGTGAYGLQLMYDRLMAEVHDELGTSYGLVAEGVRPAPDFSWIEYKVRPEARWHDGKPITVEDVIFSFETHRTKSSPIRRSMLSDVTSATKVGPRTVRFTFRTPDQRKLSHTIGRLTIIPKHYWEGRDFKATTLEPPLSSGPYKIKSVDQGRSISYERVEDYWAKNLGSVRGQNNFDTITYDYYRDVNTRFEAFKAGDITFRVELSSTLWATGYAFDAVKSGAIVKAPIKLGNPAWILAWAPNGRRERFQDVRVRKAIDLAYDFEWMNKNFTQNLYARSNSYFANSSLGASGLPSPKELELLEPWRASLPPQLFTQEYQPNRTDGSGNNRKGLLKAMNLLEDAGWHVTDGKLTNAKTGQVFVAEFLVTDTLMERAVQPHLASLRRLGMDASVRRVDASQFMARLTNHDYDITIMRLPQYPLPTRSLKDYWGSASADRPGTYNFAAIKNPAIDAMLDIIATTDNEEDYFAAIKAVDRIMLWNHYTVPLFHAPQSWRAHAKELKSHPWPAPMYDDAFPESWWYEADDITTMKR